MTPSEANKQEVNYQGFQAIASDADIVLVTVRNRWFHAGATLKECVSTIRKEFPQINTFNCMFCRVDDTYQPNSRRGTHPVPRAATTTENRLQAATIIHRRQCLKTDSLRARV